MQEQHHKTDTIAPVIKPKDHKGHYKVTQAPLVIQDQATVSLVAINQTRTTLLHKDSLNNEPLHKTLLIYVLTIPNKISLLVARKITCSRLRWTIYDRMLASKSLSCLYSHSNKFRPRVRYLHPRQLVQSNKFAFTHKI